MGIAAHEQSLEGEREAGEANLKADPGGTAGQGTPCRAGGQQGHRERPGTVQELLGLGVAGVWRAELGPERAGPWGTLSATERSLEWRK